jgi:sulfate transport system permease protein
MGQPLPKLTMAGSASRGLANRGVRSQRGTEEPWWVRCLLIGVALLFSLVFLFLPLANVFYRAFAEGWSGYLKAIVDPNTLAAVKLTLTVVLVVVPLNAVFGLAAAWAIAKFEFRGKSLLITVIDLPFSVSPVVSGLLFVILFGTQGYLGGWLAERDIQVLFAVPGIVIATLFVTFPFVARELIPVMQATGVEQEQAALTLGASGWRTFFCVTLPSVKWGLLYGLILCNARTMGEFGAVSVVSGHITGVTDTLPLRVEKLYQEFNGTAAFAVSSLLALLALLTLALKTLLEWKSQRRFEQAQAAGPEDIETAWAATTSSAAEHRPPAS